MSREQRRQDRRQQARGGASTTPGSRRTPVKVQTGSRLPLIPLAVAGAVVLVVGLLAYLIVQAAQEGDTRSAAQRAAENDSPDLPGTFVPSQGAQHYQGGFNGHIVTAYCDGVEQSDIARERSGTRLGTVDENETPEATETPTATSTPAPTDTPDPDQTGTVETTPTVPTDCYNSNPPSSGDHLGVQRNVDIGGGRLINLPADPDVYPDDVEIPRDSVPHILEHAGVFVGYHCADGDEECEAVVERLRGLVNNRIDNHDNRVVMSKFLDLPEGTIGVASWTRYMTFPYTEFEDMEGTVGNFIGTHSCRFDPERFCR